MILLYTVYTLGWRVIGIYGSLIWSKPPKELIYNPCGEFRCSPEGPVSQIHSLHLHVGAPGIFWDLLRTVQMLKREWGAESNGNPPHLFISSKTGTLVPEFAVDDLPLDKNATLAPSFAVQDQPLDKTIWWRYIYIAYRHISNLLTHDSVNYFYTN